MNGVDPNEAPEGYVAIKILPESSCVGCAFVKGSDGCLSYPCGGSKRSDKTSVIFVPKNKDQPMPSPSNVVRPSQDQAKDFHFNRKHQLDDPWDGVIRLPEKRCQCCGQVVP